MGQVHIAHHGNCIDGFTSAWIFSKVYSDAIFHSCIYGKPPAQIGIAPDDHVIFVDFCYDRATMEEYAREAAHLTILDHHATAREALDRFEQAMRDKGYNVDVVFDMKRSGAGLAWDYTHQGISAQPRPMLVNYVEDRDLWRFRLRDSKQINAYISSVPLTFASFDTLACLDVVALQALGEGAQAFQTEYCRIVNQDACAITFMRYPAYIVNAHYKSISEVLAMTLYLHPDCEVAISWYQRADGLYQYSLRSREDGPDVAQEAKTFGGGGHPHSAGFTVDEQIGLPFLTS